MVKPGLYTVLLSWSVYVCIPEKQVFFDRYWISGRL